ncbi:MAG: hypothetical protein ACRC3B_21145 [Bacteroidia bacterium]
MKRILFTFAMLALLFSGCSDSSVKQFSQTAAAPPLPVTQAETTRIPAEPAAPAVEPVRPKPRRNRLAKAFTPEALIQQSWQLSPQRDTLVKGSNGTTLHIPADAFCFTDGTPVKTPVTLNLREAINPADIVLAGLTTLHNGRVLESGGMIEVTAQSEGRKLRLRKNAEIDVNVPAAARQPGMSVFEGVKANGLMNWVNPVAIDENSSENAEIEASQTSESDNFFPFRITMIGNDTVFYQKNNDTLIYEPEKIWWQMNLPAFNFIDNSRSERQITQGVNNFSVDQTQGYVFAMKKLGWANIDRLSNDSRTQQIDFVTRLANRKEYNTVNISLVFPEKNIYLPGYRKADGTYGFSHGDNEPMRLPVGENAILILSAEKGEQVYFTSHQLILQNSQTVELTAEPCTRAEMKDKLDKLL